MARVLVVYGTVEGHTRKVAVHVANRINQNGHESVLVDAADYVPLMLEEGEYAGALVCAPVHGGKHPEPVVSFLKENVDWFRDIPSGLISISLSAALPEAQYQAEAQSYADSLLAEVAWKSANTLLVAGALQYSKYNYLKRLVMQLLAERRGVSTDTSKDWEYTNWNELDRFVDRFVERCGRDRTRLRGLQAADSARGE